MKKKSLMYKSLTQFIVCVAILLLLATPLFYWLTKNFYAEDMIDIIDAVRQGKPVPSLDLEADILHGIVIQFALIVTVLGVAIVLTMRFISGRLWQPFDQTLEAIERFKLENDLYPSLAESDTEEFARLNTALQRLMTESIHSYRLQKEFTENASHELQTPLAVFQSKLDLLLQQPEITERQADIIQDLYRMSVHYIVNYICALYILYKSLRYICALFVYFVYCICALYMLLYIQQKQNNKHAGGTKL